MTSTKQQTCPLYCYVPLFYRHDVWMFFFNYTVTFSTLTSFGKRRQEKIRKEDRKRRKGAREEKEEKKLENK